MDCKVTGILTYGHLSITLDLGLNRALRWVFIFADVPRTVIGTDFPRHFNLLVDDQFRKIIDSQTLPIVIGSYAVTKQITP